MTKKLFHKRNTIEISFFSSSGPNSRRATKSPRRLKGETLRERRKRIKSVCFMTAGNVGKEIVNSWSLLSIGLLAEMPKPEVIHQKAVPRLFTREQNEYISSSMKEEPLYNYLANVAAPFCTARTGSLQMHPAEAFVNGIILTDDIRRNTGSASTPIISLVNNSVNEIIYDTRPNFGAGQTDRAFPTTDISTGQETAIVKNLRVVIGTQSILTLELSGIEEYNPAIERLRNYIMEQNEELATKSLNLSKSPEFKTIGSTLRSEACEYVNGDEYLLPYLLTQTAAGKEEDRENEAHNRLQKERSISLNETRKAFASLKEAKRRNNGGIIISQEEWGKLTNYFCKWYNKEPVEVGWIDVDVTAAQLLDEMKNIRIALKDKIEFTQKDNERFCKKVFKKLEDRKDIWKKL